MRTKATTRQPFLLLPVGQLGVGAWCAHAFCSKQLERKTIISRDVGLAASDQLDYFTAMLELGR